MWHAVLRAYSLDRAEARKLLAGDLQDGQIIEVHAGDGKLAIGRAQVH